MNLFPVMYGGGVGPEPTPIEPVLLWTNNNPSGTFDAQTITIDLSNYSGVIIESISGTSGAAVQNSSYFSKDDTDRVNGIYSTTGSYSRVINVNNSGVIFGAARQSDSVSSNSRCIPLKIYGIKEYIISTRPEWDLYLSSISIEGGSPKLEYLTKDYQIIDQPFTTTPLELKALIRVTYSSNRWTMAALKNIEYSIDSNMNNPISLNAGDSINWSSTTQTNYYIKES